MKTELFEDVFSVLENNGPTLVTELMAALRGGPYHGTVSSGRRWRLSGTPYQFSEKLQDAGFIVRHRPHGAGIASYVHHSDFSEVIDGRGKVRSVSEIANGSWVD